MQLILFDDHTWENLLPLTFTRPAAGLRVGILTIAEKWQRVLGTDPSFLATSYLAPKYPCVTGPDNLLVNGSLLPDEGIAGAIGALEMGEALYGQGSLLAFRCGEEAALSMEPPAWSGSPAAPAGGSPVAAPAGSSPAAAPAGSSEGASGRRTGERSGSGIGSGIGARTGKWIVKRSEYTGTISLVDYPWKIFVLNGQEIEADFHRLTAGRTGERLSDTVRVIGPGKIFAEPGFRAEHITLNTSGGPIYLGRDSEIMEGSCIRGPFALGEGTLVKLGAGSMAPPR